MPSYESFDKQPEYQQHTEPEQPANETPEHALKPVRIGRMALPSAIQNNTPPEGAENAKPSAPSESNAAADTSVEPTTDSGAEPPQEPPRNGGEVSGETPELFGPRKFDGISAASAAERKLAARGVSTTYSIAYIHNQARFADTEHLPDGSTQKSFELDLLADGGLYRMKTTDTGTVSLHTLHDGAVENYEYRLVPDPENPDNLAAWRQEHDPHQLERIVQAEVQNITSAEPLEARLERLPQLLADQQEQNRLEGTGGQYICPDEAELLIRIAEEGMPRVVDARAIIARISDRSIQMREHTYQAPETAVSVQAASDAFRIIMDHIERSPYDTRHFAEDGAMGFTQRQYTHVGKTPDALWSMDVQAGWVAQGIDYSMDALDTHNPVPTAYLPHVEATVSGPATLEQLAGHDVENRTNLLNDGHDYTAYTTLTYTTDPLTGGLQLTIKTALRTMSGTTIGRSVEHSVPAEDRDVRAMRNFIANPAILPITDTDYSQ